MKLKNGVVGFLVFLVISVLTGPAYGDEKDIRLSGYLKGFFTVTDTGGAGESDSALDGGAFNVLRLDLSYQPRDRLSAELAYEITPAVQPMEGDLLYASLPRPEPYSYRAFDLGERLYPRRDDLKSSFTVTQNLDRAFITLNLPAADLYLGRQPVAFGSARVINPTDVLAPYAYEVLNQEERIGVDAIRAKMPVGDMGELDGGIVFGDKFRAAESALFLRSRNYLLKTDLTFITIVFKENLLLGLDVARSIGGAGYWLEAAYTFANATADYTPEEDYFRLSTGLDYNIGNGLYGFIEYHFNGAGRGKPEEYPEAFAGIAYTEGSVYLAGRHYIAPGLAYEITPLINFTAQALLNAVDMSAYLSALFEFNFAEDVYIDAGAFISTGRKPETRINEVSGLAEREIKSEFGMYPDIYFTSIRLYF